MKIESIKKEERKEMVKHILKVIAGIGAIIIASQSPYFLKRIVDSFFRHPKLASKELIKCFRALKYQGLVSVKKRNGRVEIKLTPKGKEKLKFIEFWDLKLEKEKRWDKKWRIIIFDIPEKKYRIREMFRLKLKDFGFYQLQKSVWLYPYKCEKEIAYLRELIGARKFIKVIIAESLELDEKIYQYFSLEP